MNTPQGLLNRIMQKSKIPILSGQMVNENII